MYVPTGYNVHQIFNAVETWELSDTAGEVNIPVERLPLLNPSASSILQHFSSKKMASWEARAEYLRMNPPSFPELPDPSTNGDFLGVQMCHDVRDMFAHQIMPQDLPAGHQLGEEEPFPIKTGPDGTCFYYSLCRLVYGVQTKQLAQEMRLRILHEAMTNEDYYLSGDCYPDVSLARDLQGYKTYMHILAELSLSTDKAEDWTTAEGIRTAFRRELNCTGDKDGWASQWTVYVAANVVRRDIMMLYPDMSQRKEFCQLRREMHKLVKCKRVTTVDSRQINIMWTASATSSTSVDHFVAVVP